MSEEPLRPAGDAPGPAAGAAAEADGVPGAQPPPQPPTPGALRRPASLAALVFAALLVVLAHLPGGAGTRATGAPPPRKLLVLMDVSTSMSGEKLWRAKQAVAGLVADQRPDAIVGLITFSSEAKVLAPPRRVDQGDVAAQAQTMQVEANTYIWDALALAAKQVEAFEAAPGGRPGDPWTWVLVSDGEGNYPDRDLEEAVEVAKAHPEVTCHTIGIELGPAGRTELQRLAQLLRGTSRYVTRDALATSLRDAASLAAFSRESAAGEAVSWLVFLAAAALFVVPCALAAVLGERLPERWFTALLAVAGGALAFMAAELVLPGHGASSTALAKLQNAAYFMIVGTVLGLTLVAAEGLYLAELGRAADRAWSALPCTVFGGALAGVAGQWAYVGLVGGGALAEVALVRAAGRVLGFAFAGAIVGAAPGLAARSWRRAWNGLLGGAAGGALGGGLFEVLLAAPGARDASRLAALASLALTIGLMVDVVEQLRKRAWLVVRSGGPVGKQFIVSRPETFLGCHYLDDVCVALDGGPPRRLARLTAEADGYYVQPVEGGEVSVNGSTVDRRRLEGGDVLGVAAGQLEFRLP